MFHNIADGVATRYRQTSQSWDIQTETLPTMVTDSSWRRPCLRNAKAERQLPTHC
jgi:GH35 family endo-1,4-beta-xylanase